MPIHREGTGLQAGACHLEEEAAVMPPMVEFVVLLLLLRQHLLQPSFVPPCVRFPVLVTSPSAIGGLVGGAQ